MGRENETNYLKRYRDKKRAIMRGYKAEHGCARCPEDDPVCLDFHHRDPDDKHWRLRKRGSTVASFVHLGFDELWAEMAKCEVLCRNCHAKEHRDADELFNRGGTRDEIEPELALF